MSQHSAPVDDRPPFDVRVLINQVLDETSLTGTGEIVDKVISMIPPGCLADALRQTLTETVRQQISRHNVGPVPPAGTSQPSWKVKAYQTEIADAWRKVLRDRIAVGHGVRKLLGECTYTDLMAAANERFSHARTNLAKAEWFERLADAVRAHGADRLDALPAEVLQELVTS